MLNDAENFGDDTERMFIDANDILPAAGNMFLDDEMIFHDTRDTFDDTEDMFRVKRNMFP
jgi:hypothetical protein